LEAPGILATNGRIHREMLDVLTADETAGGTDGPDDRT